MPIYDYICGSCGQRTEVIHGIHAPGPETCPSCGRGPMTKAMHAPAIHFKGSGWAKKERAGAGAKAAKDAGTPAPSGSGDSGDSGGAATASDRGDAQGAASATESGGGSGKPSGSGTPSGSGGPGTSAASDTDSKRSKPASTGGGEP